MMLTQNEIVKKNQFPAEIRDRLQKKIHEKKFESIVFSYASYVFDRILFAKKIVFGDDKTIHLFEESATVP